MTYPLVSVVIPCYNYGRYVAQAIASALSQSWPHKEVIVVNDGSTDDSLAVIRGYADRVLVIDQANQGMNAAYQRGLKASRGDIVVFLDADDMLEPGMVEAVVQAWRPGCVKAQVDLRIIDAQARDLCRRFCHFDAAYDAARVRDSFERTGTYRWPVTVGNAYARWYLDLLFPLAVDHGLDGVLNTVAPVYGDVVTVPRVLACYRIHGANGWSNTGRDLHRLPARIADRRFEVAQMRRHARLQGVEVPGGDPLDHELPFLNYRLMALRLGLDYDGRTRDTPTRLLRLAWQALRRERLPWRLGAAHLIWFPVLATAPRAIVHGLIRWRYERARLLTALRGAIGLPQRRIGVAQREGR